VAASSALSVRISTSFAATLMRLATYSESVNTRRGDVVPPSTDGDRDDGDSGDRSGDEYRASAWGVFGEVDIFLRSRTFPTRGGRSHQQTLHAAMSQVVQGVYTNGRPRTCGRSGCFRGVSGTLGVRVEWDTGDASSKEASCRTEADPSVGGHAKAAGACTGVNLPTGTAKTALCRNACVSERHHRPRHRSPPSHLDTTRRSASCVSAEFSSATVGVCVPMEACGREPPRGDESPASEGGAPSVKLLRALNGTR
jgi:hypothetical protein